MPIDPREGAAENPAPMPETSREQIEPRIRQVAFFLPNRLGSLRRALDLLAGKAIRIGGLTVNEAAEHAVVRIVVDRPEAAYETLTEEGYGGCVTELLGVALPPGPRSGILRVLALLLAAELNLEYAYGLTVQSEGNPVLALQVDDLDLATRVLKRNGFTVTGQDQMEWPEA
jgi:hypothetical protein